MKESETRSIRLTFLMLALSVASLWFCHSVLGIPLDGNASFIIVIPILGLLLFSGALKSFKYGSLEATLNDPVSTVDSVEKETTVQADMEQVQSFAKGDVADLKSIRRLVSRTRYPILTLETRRKGYYALWGIDAYVNAFSVNSGFKYVVIIEGGTGKFLAYIKAIKLAQILQQPALGNEFIQALENDDIDALTSFGFQRAAISTETRIIEAIRAMMGLNEESILVLDKNKRISGIVERDYLVAKILLQLTTSA